MSENGQWKLAFWIVTSFFVIAVSTIATNVIANDRLRASEDIRIQTEFNDRLDKYMAQKKEGEEVARLRNNGNLDLHGAVNQNAF